MASPANLHVGMLHERLFEHAQDVMLVFDLEGRLQRLNAAGRELVGLADQEVAGTPLLDLVHPNDRGALGERLAALRAGDHWTEATRTSSMARLKGYMAWPGRAAAEAMVAGTRAVHKSAMRPP